MLHIENIRYNIGSQPILALNEWHVNKGEHWLILGPSGCGKSSLLHLISGLVTPTAGTIRLADTAITQLPPTARDAFRGKHIGIIFQTLHLVKALTVTENLILANTLAGVPVDHAYIQHLLTSLGLSDKAHSYPHTLSHGQAQRVAIARALVNRPAVILADEPTSALDDAHCDDVIRLLQEQAAHANATLIIATHDARVKQRFTHVLELRHE